MLIMVVDDERWARKDLIRAIRQTAEKSEWGEKAGVSIVEAQNGREAWEKIGERVPDMLITDIRMPVVDGLQLIARVKSAHPQVVCLIASGYDEFEYAKQGIQYGVTGYLLKPVRESELSVLLNQVYCRVKDVLRRNLFHWLNGEQTVCKPPGLKWGGNIGIFVVLSGNWQTKTLLDYAVDEEGYQCRPDNQPNMIVHLTSLPAAGSALENRTFAQNTAFRWLKRLPGSMAHVAYGIAESWSQLPELYGEIRKRLWEGLCVERRQVIHPEWRPDAEMPDMHEIWNRVRIVEQAMASGSKRELRERWNIVFRYISGKSLAQEKLKTVLIDIFVGVSYHQCGLSALQTNDLLEKQCEIESLVTYAELEARTFEWLEAIQYEVAHQAENKSARQLLPIIVRDLQSRYTESIRLKQVAEAYGIHPSHLSRLFKEEYGINFTGFMNDLRLRKTKELLRETSLKPSEVADVVGFSDAKYFGFWFAKMTGMSPSAYRKNRFR